MTWARLVVSLTPARKRAVFIAADLAMIPVAYVCAFAVFNSTFAPLKEVAHNATLLLILCSVALLLSIGLGVPDFRLKDLGRPVVGRLAVFSALLGCVAYVFASVGGLGIRPGYHIVFSLTYLALIGGCRVVMLHLLLSIYRQSASVTRVLIYGAGGAGMALAASLRGRDDIFPVAFVDDNAALNGLVVAGLPVFPGKSLDEVAVRLRASRAILAMPSRYIAEPSPDLPSLSICTLKTLV